MQGWFQHTFIEFVDNTFLRLAETEHFGTHFIPRQIELTHFLNPDLKCIWFSNCKFLDLYLSNTVALCHFFSPVVKSRFKYRAGLTADHWPAFSTDVKMHGSVPAHLHVSSWGTQGHINFNYLTGMQKTLKDLRIIGLSLRIKLGTFQLKVTSVTLSTDVVSIAVLRLPRTQNWTRDLTVKNKHLTTRHVHSDFL